jgi:hydrophobe/amphiphile efflux-3 (HAE3) family protein
VKLGTIAEFVAKKPKTVVAVILLVIFLSLISSSNVKFGVMSYEELLPVGDKVWLRYQMYQKDFGISENSIFIFVKGDDVLTRESLEYMLTLSEEIEKLDGVGEVISPASIVLKVYGKLPENDAITKEIIEKYASDLLPSPSMAIMIVPITATGEDKQNEIAKQIESIIEYTPKPVGITAQATGSPMLHVQIIKSIRDNLRITTSASILLMILILVVTFSGVVRRKITAFMPLVISIFSVVSVTALMPILGVRMTSHISSIMPILIGLAIEYGAQIQSRFEEERLEGRSRDEAVVKAITRTGLAVVMAMLTTVIGFMSMCSSLIPMLSWFGILMSIGLVFAYIYSTTFLPAVLKLMDKDVRKVIKRKVGVLERVLMAISGFTAKNSRVILAFALIVIVFGAYANTQIKLETDTKKYFPQDIPAMIRFKELERVVGGQYPFVVVLSVDEVNSKTLKEVDELAKYVVGREDLVYDYSSLSSLVKRFAGDIPSDDRLNYVMSQIPEEELKKYVSGNLLAIYFKTNADTHDKRVELWDSLDKDIRFFGFSDYYITGNTVVMTEVGKLMLSSQLIMTLVAYGLIVILLFGVYRSLTRAVTPLLAITTVIGVVNTYMYLFGIKQTMISLALNSITLGLGIDFSIHITERYFEERRNFSPIESVRRTIERTGKAIVTSALTMAGGFGALAFSSFPALRDFGILSLIAIIFSLISALTVVPAFLMTTEKFRVNLDKLTEVVKNNVKA